MIKPPYFIAEEEKFSRLLAGLESTIRSSVRLPMVPFQDPFKVRGFEEFDWAMSGEFWSALQALASQSGDHELVLCVLDPDPASYFKAQFGYYSWATLPATLSSNDYWDFLNSAPVESPADSVLANAQVVVFTVPSRQWIVWGERESGLCVLAALHGDQSPAWNDLEWIAALHPTQEWKAFASEIAEQFGSPPTPDS
ncbi:MAG: hypothetical protein KDK97_00085 [Verrucomicrobiales bacterium]|nr:hypothetical protein [Verrucomicrobiales bacterium]MCP5557331.1 hypothetical protein [Verrucomicrobiaceae bacterium]